jgi:hypothetical protein
VLAGPIVRAETGHRYYLLSQSVWTQAEAEAVTLGGHLVTINSTAENDWVVDTFSTFGGVDRSLWIGLNDQVSEGVFVWISGEAAAYTNWAPGQADNGSPGPDPPGEDFVHLLWPGHPNAGMWNDFQNLSSANNFPLHAVVELPKLIGDLNNDGFVGIGDLNIVLGNWNQNVTPSDPTQGDPSGDGFVGIEDLNAVLGNWNAGTPPPGSAAPPSIPGSAVPEPTAALLPGVLWLIARRSKRGA